MSNEIETPDEDAQMFDWRYDYALHLGIEPEHAAIVALTREVDLHRVEAMVEHGCPLALALEIAA